MVFFEKLPSELLLMIANIVDPPPLPIPFIPKDEPSAIADLASFSMVNRRMYNLLTATLYDRYGHLAVPWACQKPSLATLKAVQREFNDQHRWHTIISTPSALKSVLKNDKLVKTCDFHLVPLDWRNPGPGRPTLAEEVPEISRWVAAPLHLACAGGHDDIVEFLLDNGASTEAHSARFCECMPPKSIDPRITYFTRDVPIWLPLHHALCCKHTSTALLMLRRGASVIVTQGGTDEEFFYPKVTALHLAAEHGLHALARVLIEQWQQHFVDMGWVDGNGFSPVHYLALNPSYSSVVGIAQTFQTNGMDADFSFLNPYTPLILACHIGNFTAARALMDVGADPHAIDLQGIGCMRHAMKAIYGISAGRCHSRTTWESERLRLVKQLVRANALSRFPLSDAVRFGLVDELKFLLDAGTSFIDQIDDEDMTPLAHAATKGDVAAVELLLAAGASVSHFQGTISAAEYVCDREPVTGVHAKILLILLKHGATVGFCCEPDDLVQLRPEYAGSVLDDAMWRIESNPRLRTGHGVRSSTFSFLLQHSTPVNFPRACWQQAVFVNLESDDMKLTRASGVILKQLMEFGARFGYVFEDSMLCICLGVLIGKGNVEDLNAFFSLGGPDGVSGETGLVTQKAALFLAMANFNLQVFKWNKPLGLIQHLLKQLSSLRGKVGLLGNTTLLHLSCSMGEPAIVNMILESESDDHDLQTQWCSMTPLMLAVGQDNRHLEIVRLLLARGADPYLVAQGVSTNGCLSPDELPDLLGPENGNLLSRSIRGMFHELRKRHQRWVSEQLQPPSGQPDNMRSIRLDLSAFELAIIKGRTDIVEEFLNHKPLPEEWQGRRAHETQSPSREDPGQSHVGPDLALVQHEAERKSPGSPQSYLGLAITWRHFDCFKILLAAGANINADPECPLLAYQLSQLIRSAPTRLFRRDPLRQEAPSGDGEANTVVDLDWLGQQIAILVLLLKAGADPGSRSNTFPKSFNDQLLAVFDNDVRSLDPKNPDVLLQRVLREAFTFEQPDPTTKVSKVKINLEGTEEWLDSTLHETKNSERFKWPSSWREWKAKWTSFTQLEHDSGVPEIRENEDTG